MTFATVWTPEMEAALDDMAGRKMSASQIAGVINKRFGTVFTRSAVLGKCHRKKQRLDGPVFQGVWTPEIEDALRELAARRMTSTQIQKALQMRCGVNIRHSGICRKCRQLDILLPGANRSPRPKRPARNPWHDVAFVAPLSPPIEPDEEIAVATPKPRADGQLHDTMSITDKDCHWPLEGHGKGLRYCGSKAMREKSYCMPHFRQAHQGAAQ